MNEYAHYYTLLTFPFLESRESQVSILLLLSVHSFLFIHIKPHTFILSSNISMDNNSFSFGHWTHGTFPFSTQSYKYYYFISPSRIQFLIMGGGKGRRRTLFEAVMSETFRRNFSMSQQFNTYVPNTYGISHKKDRPVSRWQKDISLQYTTYKSMACKCRELNLIVFVGYKRIFFQFPYFYECPHVGTFWSIPHK